MNSGLNCATPGAPGHPGQRHVCTAPMQCEVCLRQPAFYGVMDSDGTMRWYCPHHWPAPEQDYEPAPDASGAELNEP